MSAVADRPPGPAAPEPARTRTRIRLDPRRALTEARALIAAHPRTASALGVALLVLLSLYLRSQALTAKFWIDEGLSVGIAHHGFFDIPSVLRQDGSPPLYYLLLHVWMAVVGGDGESRTHALSLLFALLMVPAGWWGGRELFGARAAWATAALCATCPFVTYYAQETRMYALVMLLGLVSSGTFALAYALRRRAMLPLFSLSTVLLVYSHNWGLFLAAGLAVAFGVLAATTPAQARRPLLRDGVLGFGAVAVLYLPWVPMLVAQARETGAPWSERPAFAAILDGLQQIAGGTETALAVALIGTAGLATLAAGREGTPRARAAMALGVAFCSGILLAWLTSQVSPAWAGRYFAPFTGPAMLMLGAGLVRYGKVGLIALAIVLALWFDPRERAIKSKSDVFRVTTTLEEKGLVAPGDLVVAVHPEQGPLLRYYLGPDIALADALGPVEDPQVFDWRHAQGRLEATGPVRVMRELAPQVRRGHLLVLMLPIIRTSRWGAPWTSLVRRRSAQWERALDRDRRFIRVAAVPEFGRRALPRGLRAVVYLRD